MPIPSFDPAAGLLPAGVHQATWDDVLDRFGWTALLDLSAGRVAQKQRFFGELFPDWVETGSGLVFSEFFQLDRVHGTKGIVVIDPRSVPS